MIEYQEFVREEIRKAEVELGVSWMIMWEIMTNKKLRKLISEMSKIELEGWGQCQEQG